MGKGEGKRPLEISIHKWENNTEMDLKEGGLEGVNWIQPILDKDQWRDL